MQYMCIFFLQKTYGSYMDWVLIPKILLYLWVVISTSCSSAFPVAKEGCEDHCGNVSIPYPFGTKENCYLQEDFFINCSNGKAFLSSNNYTNNISVKSISYEGQLQVLYPIGYMCYDPETNASSDFKPNMTLPRNSMAFSRTRNKFTVIGCDTYAIVRGQSYDHTYTTGCISVCVSKTDVVDGNCSGVGCCQTSIPDRVREVNISVHLFEDYMSVWDFNPCSYAFVVDESQYQFYAHNLSNINKDISVPVVLDWVIGYNDLCKVAKTNQTSYACVSEDSECVDHVPSSGYTCRCKNGFHGNPYLSNNSCQDIDECVAPNHSNCKSHSTCSNTRGSYNCNCDQGYHSIGGTSEDRECIANYEPSKTKVYWTIFTAVGSCTIVVILLYLWYSKMITIKEDSSREEHFRKNGGFLLQEKLNSSQRGANSYSVKLFTAEELLMATNDFDNTKVIGQGGFGTVYKGELIDETIVAIKKSRGIDQRGVEQFINEVILLSQINNRNVVKLLGCCLETEMPLLVYEFINNGTLLEHLKGLVGNCASQLSWNIRMRIASQVAGVLFYLHSCASPQIIHRDIKSSNILLDQDCMAKVADFGISRLVSMDENQLSTMVQGTPGYLDPEYMHTGVFTEKSDVYSFGVVLIELLTANKVFSLGRPVAERFLSSYFLHQLNNDNLDGILDHNMGYDFENIEQIKEVSMIAKRCISVKGEDRPYMKEVLRDLEKLQMQVHDYVANAFEKDSKACGSSDGHPSILTSL